tara:strand:- start:43 stop:435 length:393 start_codon:yes stop_codon:yes gene_type:complete
MSGNNDLILKIKQYLEVDKQIEALNQSANELRKRRTTLEEQLVSAIRSKNMDNKMLTINKDLGLVCQPNKVLPTLTIETIKLALLEKMGSQETVNNIIRQIVNYREKNRKTTYIIKKRKPGRRSFRKKKV